MMQSKLLYCILLFVVFCSSYAKEETSHLISVSAPILQDSVIHYKPLTTEDLFRMGIWEEEVEDAEPIVGRKYMDFNTITIQGKSFSQEQLQGKVTMIDVWYQGCAPCVVEFEFFNKLYLNYSNNPTFQLFTFTFDTEEDAKEVAKKHNLLYDVACIDRKECYRLNYNAGFPTIIIIDQYGTVSFYDHGGHTDKEKVAEYFKKLEYKVDDLLKQL